MEETLIRVWDDQSFAVTLGAKITRRISVIAFTLGATRPGDWTLKVINIFYR